MIRARNKQLHRLYPNQAAQLLVYRLGTDAQKRQYWATHLHIEHMTRREEEMVRRGVAKHSERVRKFLLQPVDSDQ